MEKEYIAKLTELEIATIVGLLSERVRFFKNELKKPRTNLANNYPDFCNRRIKYYESLISKVCKGIQDELAR